MITSMDHDNTMDDRNNNFLNSSSNGSEQQNSSGLTKAELRKVGSTLWSFVQIQTYGLSEDSDNEDDEL